MTGYLPRWRPRELRRTVCGSRWTSAATNPEAGNVRTAHNAIHRGALQAARQAVLAMRTNDEIGDDAFHQIEEELDWLEMAGGENREIDPDK